MHRIKKLGLSKSLACLFVILVTVLGLPLTIYEMRMEYPDESILSLSALVCLILAFSFSALWAITTRVRGEFNIFGIVAVILIGLFFYVFCPLLTLL